MMNYRPLLWLILITNSLALIIGLIDKPDSKLSYVVRVCNLICIIGLGWVLIRNAPSDNK